MTPTRRSWACTAVVLAAVATTTPARAFKLAFDRISLQQGLSQALIPAILQDREGFLWAGTMDGLNRYDGYSFTVFRHDSRDPRSLSHDWITALAMDGTGRLWIGTRNGGLNLYDPSTRGFVRHQHDASRPNSLSSDEVTSLWVAPTGHLWVGVRGGVDRFDPQTGESVRHPLAVPGDPAVVPILHSICPSVGDPRVLWLGTSHGLFRFSTDGGDAVHFSHRQGDDRSLIHDEIHAIYESPSAPGRVWVGTLGGLDLFNVAESRFDHWLHDDENPNSISSNRIRSIYEDRDGGLWIGTGGGGLNRLDRRTGRFTHYVNDPQDGTSLGQNLVLTITQDRAGSIWLGTSGGGLNRINVEKSRFVYYRNRPGDSDSLTRNDVLSVHVTLREPHVLWVGNQEGGLNRVERLTGKVTHYLPDPKRKNSLARASVSAIRESPDGKLWLAAGKTLELFDPATGLFTHFRHDPRRPDSLPDDFVTALLVDRRGRLWVGLRSHGLALMTSPDGAFRLARLEHDDDGTLPADRIANVKGVAIIESREEPDVLWVGTDRGLYRFDINAFAGKRRPVAIADTRYADVNYVMSIAASSAEPGVYWLGTNGGLVRFDAASLDFNRIREGLPGSLVYAVISLATGDDEELWLSTNNGLCRFRPRSNHLRAFGLSDGIQVSDFNAGAYFHSSAGEVFFGGTLGLYAFFPMTITESIEPPPVVITQIRVNEVDVPALQSILDRRELVLGHSQNFVSFEFSALDFSVPEKNRFAYRMEGIDRDWVYREADRRFASYTDMEPGTYSFHVKAAKSDGAWGANGVSLRLVVRPPFWRTWWAYLLFGLLGIGSAYGVYRWRVQSLKQRQQELELLVAQRTQELKETSLRDPLTGLCNRRFITEFVQTESQSFLKAKHYLAVHERSRRNDQLATKVFGVFMLDIDHFKEVNDRHGHVAGDRMLVQLAKILLDSTRRDDVVVRMGGEEFLVILKKTEAYYVDEFCRKIKDKIEKQAFLVDEHTINMHRTCSIGCCVLPFYADEPDLVTLEQVIGLADLALLQSKRAGRNRSTRIKPTAVKIPPAEFGGVLASLEHGLARGWLEISTL